MQRTSKQQTLTIRTHHVAELLDITHLIGGFISENGLKDEILTIFVPHTTAGITLNEAADPAVKSDLLLALDRAFPDLPDFRHQERNSSAHVKASLMGSSCQVIVEDGQLKLGT